MAAALGPSWGLRAPAAPRCLTAYAAGSASCPDAPGSADAVSQGSNPFDDDGPRRGQRRRGRQNQRGEEGDAAEGYAYSVAFGTERGSLHYRQYPSPSDAHDDGDYRRGGYGRDRGRDPGQQFVDPDPSSEGQIDLQGAVKGSIVGVVRAALPDAFSASAAPVFLLLVDDRRGSPSAQPSNPGAHAAHLVTTRHGAFHKLPAAPSFDGSGMPAEGKPPASHAHRRGGSHGGGGGWFGGDPGPPRGEPKGLGGTAQGAASGSTSSTPSVGALPRMSCVAYHPDAGYVCAAGTGVCGLPAPAVRAVLAGLAASSGEGGQRGGFHHSASARPKQQAGATGTLPPAALYLNCGRALPSPGVRCSSGGGGSNGNAMALACRGRIAVVAVGNAFYAVPCCLDVNGLKHRVLSGSGQHVQASPRNSPAAAALPNVVATKLLTFAQSSQVHPVIAVEIATASTATPPFRPSAHAADALAKQLRPISSVLFLASGRECVTLEVASVPDARAVGMINKGSSVPGGVVATSIKASTLRHDVATLPSPILAAAALPSAADGGGGRGGDLSSGPLVALLTVDGLVHVRSPSCVAVPLASLEVGTRPNDFFTLSALPALSANETGRTVVATSYGGEARLLSIQSESPQDFADRLIKLCIDAFGPNGFPRLELAEALGATFSATSYTGAMEPSPGKRGLLRQYLESVLGLADDGLGGPRDSSSSAGGGGNANSAVTFVMSKEDGQESGLEVEGGIAEDGSDNEAAASDAPSSSSLGANSLLACTALLCLVCYQLKPPKGTAACRASKACASSMGIVRPGDRSSGVSKAAAAVCELIADRLLREVSSSFSVLTGASSSTTLGRPSSPGSASMEFVESAVWLLRSCGCHEKAIDVLQERMNSPAFRNAAVGVARSQPSSQGAVAWSQLKFDSYFATHLGELWSSKDDQCRKLVLSSPATKDLIARNPTLGLSVFTTAHPQNETEWKRMRPADDPLAHPLYPSKVVQLLKSVEPHQETGVSGVGGNSPRSNKTPVDSGRALAVSYLESAIGIATGRPSESTSEGAPASSSFHADSHPRNQIDERKADMHDELAYLLLEAVISERGDSPSADDNELGALYRFKLRRLLSWPNSLIRSDRLLGSLPSSFLREHALLLGRLGRHEDALQILYSQEKSLELALEYCDVRHERKLAQIEEARARGSESGGVSSVPQRECAYLPLVKVALSSDPDSDRGIAAAIQVLALRRNAIDKAAALRLLPKDLPMSSVVRPFLIPAVVENESQVRRLEVASSLMRSKYQKLKRKLTEAQLKSQSTLRGALALKGLNLGEPLYSSKPTKARPVHAASPHFPDVTLVKHFFSRHLVIQAEVRNNTSNQSDGRTLADVAFVIAESSEEALVPTMGLPLKMVPPDAMGSAWCILAASPQRLDGSAFLACELRFTVLDVDAATGTPLSFGEGPNAPRAGFGRTFVEELTDMEVRHTEFG